MGSLIKDYISKLKNKSRTDIYHLTVMPCFDKKLEASRDQFFDVDTQTKDVDCVITSSMYKFSHGYQKKINTSMLIFDL